MEEREKYYTVSEVCEILHSGTSTVYAYIRSGQLPAYRPGGRRKFLIAESDLNNFIKVGIEPGYYQKLYPRPHKGDKVAQDQ